MQYIPPKWNRWEWLKVMFYAFRVTWKIHAYSNGHPLDPMARGLGPLKNRSFPKLWRDNGMFVIKTPNGHIAYLHSIFNNQHLCDFEERQKDVAYTDEIIAEYGTKITSLGKGNVLYLLRKSTEWRDITTNR